MMAIEEMNGVDVHCADKIDTFTLNCLTIDKNIIDEFHKDLEQRSHIQKTQSSASHEFQAHFLGKGCRILKICDLVFLQNAPN